MRELRRVAAEAALVLLAGLVLGLTANALNLQKGLRLTKDYFHAQAELPTQPAGTDGSATRPAAPATQEGAGTDTGHQLSAYIAEAGIRAISDEATREAFSSPLHQTGQYLFIDARDDGHFTAGHIPGTYQLNHYYLEQYIAEVLPLALQAEKVIVYCEGGTCDDSELAAVDLLQRGVPADRLFIYVGGMHLWRERGRPIERGPRGSGNITEGAP